MTQDRIEGKYKIEINFVGDGRIYVNYWDWCHGNDVVAQFRNGKLYDEHNNRKQISFQKFIDLLQETILKQDC